MHHFVYCQKDTFIYNEESARTINFGLDKVVEISTVNKLSRTFKTVLSTTEVKFSLVTSENFQNFTGYFTGSICDSTGSVAGLLNCGSHLSPGGLCEPVGVEDDNGNSLILDDGNGVFLSLPSDFFIFP